MSDNARVRVYETADGFFAIADDGGWWPGVYDTEATARHAATLDFRFVQAVADRVMGDPFAQDRAITMKDMNA